MARATTAGLLALLLLLALAPATGALGLPAPLGQTERVTSWYWQDADGWCYPSDPVLGVVGTDPRSEVTHEAVQGGTRYDLHLESLFDMPGCPTLDVSFVSTLAAWPTAYSTTAPLTSPCGATGSLTVYASPESYHMQIAIHLPAACGAAVTGWVGIGATVQPIRPSEYMVCVPVPLPLSPCVGAADEEYPWYRCPDGQPYQTTYVTLVAYVSRQCDPRTGESYVVLSPAVGVVWIEARESSCTVVVTDGFFGVVDERAPCPEEVRALLYDGDWGNVLP